MQIDSCVKNALSKTQRQEGGLKGGKGGAHVILRRSASIYRTIHRTGASHSTTTAPP